MQYREFVETVGQRAGIDSQRAETASKAVVQALVEQVGQQRAHGLVDQLPRGLHPDVEAEAAGARSLGDFYHRVGELESPDGTEPDRHTEAVFATLNDAVTGGQLREVVGQLPTEYHHLLPSEAQPVSAEVFLAAVQERGELPSVHEAAAVTRITLGGLADRVTAGQARDLAAPLPGEIRPYLEGRAEATVFSAEDLIEHVTHAQQVDWDVSASYVRAVLQTLGDHVPRKEIDDTRAQLPADFAQLFD